MGYESLSTVVVLVIVAIIIVVWLPVRTANGMKRVDEHRQDRYSPSLHIVDAENGRRFGDIKPHKAKGAAMPASTPSARLTSEHIAHVRELRRAAIRRRQQGYLSVSHPVAPASVRAWPFGTRLVRNAMGMLSPLL